MNPQDKISPHFTYLEATYSSTAAARKLPNVPSDEQLATICRTAMRMEGVRDLLGSPIIVYPGHRWFSSIEINKLVGGVSDSQHLTGEAVDFECPGFGSTLQVCNFLKSKASEIGYDQLIYEGTWVHISFNTSREGQRRLPRMQYLDLSGRVA